MSAYRTKSINIGNYKNIIIQNESLNSSCIGCIVKCGSTNDNKGKSGICGIVNHIVLNSENSKKIIARGERIGFKIHQIFEREYTYLYIHTYNHLYSEAVELLMELINSFVCTEEDLAEAISFMNNKIMYELDNIDSFIINSVHENIFTRQLIGKSKYGKMKTIHQISLEEVKSFYSKNYNHKNIVFVVSSPVDIDQISDKLSNISSDAYEDQNEIKHTFSSFKRYMLHKKIKYIYKNTKNTYINLVFQMGGFRNYEKKIYANLIKNILGGYTKSALDSNYEVELIEYNSVSVMIIKFIMFQGNIMEQVQEVLNKISKLKVSEETYSEIIKNMVDESLSISLNSVVAAHQFATHYINLRKIKKHNFDLEILYSFNKSKVQQDLKSTFNLLNLSLFVFGPKHNKSQVNKINLK